MIPIMILLMLCIVYNKDIIDLEDLSHDVPAKKVSKNPSKISEIISGLKEYRTMKYKISNVQNAINQIEEEMLLRKITDSLINVDFGEKNTGKKLKKMDNNADEEKKELDFKEQQQKQISKILSYLYDISDRLGKIESGGSFNLETSESKKSTDSECPTEESHNYGKCRDLSILDDSNDLKENSLKRHLVNSSGDSSADESLNCHCLDKGWKKRQKCENKEKDTKEKVLEDEKKATTIDNGEINETKNQNSLNFAKPFFDYIDQDRIKNNNFIEVQEYIEEIVEIITDKYYVANNIAK